MRHTKLLSACSIALIKLQIRLRCGAAAGNIENHIVLQFRGNHISTCAERKQSRVIRPGDLPSAGHGIDDSRSGA